MGIREIRDKMERKRYMQKKATEFKIEEIRNDLENAAKTKEKLEELARKYGVIIATSPELQDEIERIRKQYGIPKEAVITQVMSEEEVIKKGMLGIGTKIDHEKLGMLLYQRAMLKRKENGGIMTLSEAYFLVNTGKLAQKLEIKDVENAIKILEKNKLIPGTYKLKSGVKIISFFPIEFTDDQNEILSIASRSGFVTLEEIMLKTGWTKVRAQNALQALEQEGITRKDESYAYGERYYFPGLMH
ncbi:MAG: EAP30/Vps36 family vacuolar-sorting protein [Candidatus Jordarchaeaceae archaeon]